MSGDTQTPEALKPAVSAGFMARLVRILQWAFPQGMADIVISVLTVAVVSFLSVVWWHLSQRGELAALLNSGLFGSPWLVTALAYSAVYLALLFLMSCSIRSYACGLWSCLRSQAGSPAMTADKLIRSICLLGSIAFLLMSAANVAYSTIMLRLAYPDSTVSVTTQQPVSVSTSDDCADKKVAKECERPANNGHGWIFMAGIALPAVLLGAWWTIKDGLFLVAVARSRSEHATWWRSGRAETVGLLSSQWVGFSKLLELVDKKQGSTSEVGVACALKGPWGAAKSYLLQQFELAMAGVLQTVDVYRYDAEKKQVTSMSEPVPGGLSTQPYVKVMVWSEETELDLQFSILRGLLLHPAILFTSAWDSMLTPGLTMQILVRRLKCWFQQLRLKTSAVEMDISLGIPLPWQKYLDKLAAITPSGFVVVLDEIDRATPPMAQVAIAMIRRSLDKPGITVIVPYVPEQIRYKVFNPLLCETTDLQSSILADIWNDLITDQAAGKLIERLSTSPFDDDEHEHLERNLESSRHTAQSAQTADKEQHSSITKKLKRAGGVSPATPLSDIERLRQGLLAWYLQRLQDGGNIMFEQFCDRFEEKFLSRRIVIKSVLPETMPELVQAVPLLRQFFSKDQSSRPLPLPEAGELIAACKKLKEQATSSEEFVSVNLRKLIGVLAERLTDLQAVNLQLVTVTTQDVIAVIAFEYYRMVKAAGRLEAS